MSGEKSKVDMDKLAQAFDSDPKDAKKNKAEMEKQIGGGKKSKKKSPKNKKTLALFIVGMVVLVGGLAFLIYKLVSGPSMADAEFLIDAGEWTEEDLPSVVWDFTEVGKGKLTTDGHQNNYDFVWTIDGNKLKIETVWLYNLNDEFEYSLDQGAKVLTLKNKEKGVEVKFKANK